MLKKLLKHVLLCPRVSLSVITVALYLPALFFGYTELDDSIFIREFASFNARLSNVVTAFQRGLFHATDDIYYRPLFSVSIILNYQLSGTSITGYRIVNILLHLACVLMVYCLLKELHLKPSTAFLLAMLFAIHPVLVQAVVWIPGRNDSLLAFFIYPFFITAIRYINAGKMQWLILHTLSLAAALFTKETAVFAPPAAMLILLYYLKKKPTEKSMLLLYATWSIAALVYLMVRMQASLNSKPLLASDLFFSMLQRLPVLLHYIGKVILPFNLSVFPMQKDTSSWYGIAAMVLLMAGIRFAVTKDFRAIVTGAVFFLLFLIPVLAVPPSLNDQIFEHRLYIPLFGMLLIFSQTILFQNRLQDAKQAMLLLPLIVLLITLNLLHQQKFKSPLAFWTAAVASSPSSAYARMMLGMRMDKINKAQADSLIMLSYQQDSTAKYINYYMGKVREPYSREEAEKHYLRETEISGYVEAYFELARMAFEKNDLPAAAAYLEKYIAKAPQDEAAHRNLLLLYLDTGQPEKARLQMQKMQKLGIRVPPEITERLR
ncbi:MAG: hypothetical protein KatS3mg031_1930 [Chitinophagales bacterium]|nr:MAG: hypothetical protein KatS3mg031_1930 [Chitinophagales bacterium]